jgi:hypothetical protein
VAAKRTDDGEPRWIYLPIARVGRRGFCETSRCQGSAAVATTFHSLINIPGKPNQDWVACAECTRLMVQGAHPTTA